MLPVAKGLLIITFGIFPHSSWLNISSKEIFFGLLACMAFLRFLHTFSIIFICLTWRYFMVDFEVCLRSLSWWNTQPLFNFNIQTDLRTASRMFGAIHSSFHWRNISCSSSCHTTPKHNGSSSMLNSWPGVLLYKYFFLQKNLLW